MTASTSRAWDQFRASRLWRVLRRSDFLRSALYLAIELRSAWREPVDCSRDKIDLDLARSRDPWSYESSPLEKERFERQTLMIDAVRAGRRFRRGAEIGCAEGKFTEVLAQRCDALLVLDLSPTALERTAQRRAWPASVTFVSHDFRSDPLPGKFDLIVVAGVLEYFSRRTTMKRLRKRLVAALDPGGYLLVETTRANPVVEGSWWGRWMVRGKWINAFMAQHPMLEAVAERNSGQFAISLCRKVEQVNRRC